MKNTLVTAIFILQLSICAAQGYNITFKSNVNYGEAFLAFYQGKNLNVQDSAMINNQGIAVFKNKVALPGGIYAVVYGDKKFSSDFLIDKEQTITITADTQRLAKTIITGSKDNAVFAAYQNFVAEKGRLLVAEKKAFETATSAADSALHEKKYNELNSEINNYRYNIINNEPKSMMAALLLAMKGPAQPQTIPITAKDSLDNYYFYKEHYWDGFSFSDSRLVRTPFFLPRLETYYREVMQQGQTDTIIRDIDYKLLLARTAPEMYKFLLNWFTDEYINPKYMGQDAIFVHLYEKYHSKGLTSWLNEKQMKTITDRAYMQMSNLIGEQAANIEMLDTKEDTVSLYDVQSPYTLVVFWDPTCGHCKEEIPKIDSIYRASWKEKGMKIFAVLTEKTEPVWLKFIQEHKIQDWIHVHQSPEMAEAERLSQRPGYRQSFDVIMTPTLLLLDKDKRIIAKKLNLEQIDAFLTVKTKQ